MDFLAEFGETRTLVTVVQEDRLIGQKIFEFLSRKDQVRLGMTCKYLWKFKNQLSIQEEGLKFNTWVRDQIQPLKKKNKNQNCKVVSKENSNLLKINLFDFRRNLLNKEMWSFMEEKDIKTRILDEKFVENQNLFFVNNLTNDILFMNRSLIDKSLDFDEKRWSQDIDEDKSETYQKLYQGNEYSDSQNFDFSSKESLLQRQKQFLNHLNDQKLKREEDAKIENCLDTLQSLKRITIILCCGGQFSIGIFEQNKCIMHKTDKKYVVRKKQGQRQLNKDSNSGSNIQSIGSQIRRDQEKKHQEKVHNILTENLEEISLSQIVFLYAPGINKLLLVQDNEPLFAIKHKLRSICLSSKKANFTEVERIYKTITKLYFIHDYKK